MAFDQLGSYATPSNTFDLSGIAGLGASAVANNMSQNPYGSINLGDLGNTLSQSGSTNYGGLPTLGSVYNSMASTSPTVTTQQNNMQNPSAPLQSAINSYQSQLQGLANNTQSAYQGYQSTFGNLINTLTNLYGKQGSTAQAGAATSALGMGANPLAASQAGLGAQQNMLSQYFPALSQLQQQAGQVPIQAQQAQQSIDQMAQQFIQGTLSPYYQGIAGQQSTGQTTNPMAQQQVLAQLASQGSQYSLQQQQQQNQLAQAQMQAQLGYSQLGANTGMGLGNLGLNAQQQGINLAEWVKQFQNMTGVQDWTMRGVGGQGIQTGVSSDAYNAVFGDGSETPTESGYVEDTGTESGSSSYGSEDNGPADGGE